MSSLIQVIKAVEAVAVDKHWIPLKYRDITFFSIHDTWIYNIVIDDRLCEICTANAVPFTYSGIHLRAKFPYLEIESEDRIKAHAHMPRDDNCRCWLERSNVLE